MHVCRCAQWSQHNTDSSIVRVFFLNMHLSAVFGGRAKCMADRAGRAFAEAELITWHPVVRFLATRWLGGIRGGFQNQPHDLRKTRESRAPIASIDLHTTQDQTHSASYMRYGSGLHDYYTDAPTYVLCDCTTICIYIFIVCAHEDEPCPNRYTCDFFAFDAWDICAHFPRNGTFFTCRPVSVDPKPPTQHAFDTTYTCIHICLGKQNHIFHSTLFLNNIQIGGS